MDPLHTRMPMPEALRRFAADLDDPGADLIITTLIINARLRGPGLRDLLGALSESSTEEALGHAAEGRTRSAGPPGAAPRSWWASGSGWRSLALLNRSYVQAYDSTVGQLVLVVVVALSPASWMSQAGHLDTPERLLAGEEPRAGRGRGPGWQPPVEQPPASSAPAVASAAGSPS